MDFLRGWPFEPLNLGPEDNESCGVKDGGGGSPG